MKITKNTLPILFSDVDYGTVEYGFISRVTGADPDDEDLTYERHLRKMGLTARVVDGFVKVMHADCDNRGGACEDCRGF